MNRINHSLSIIRMILCYLAGGQQTGTQWKEVEGGMTAPGSRVQEVAK